MEIQPITWETMHSLSPIDRYECIRKYQEWVRKVRKSDKLVQHRLQAKIWAFKHQKPHLTHRYVCSLDDIQVYHNVYRTMNEDGYNECMIVKYVGEDKKP